MRHAHYMLNPGDLFQVDVEKVMYATGEPRTDKFNEEERSRYEAMEKALANLELEIKGRRIKEAKEAEKKKEEGEEDADEAEAETETETETAEAETKVELSPEEQAAQRVEEEKRARHIIKRLIKSAKDLLSKRRELDLSVAEKQELRLFSAQAKRLLPIVGITVEEGQDPIAGLAQLLARFGIDKSANQLRKTEEIEAAKQEEDQTVHEPKPLKDATEKVSALSEESRRKYDEHLQEGLTRAEQTQLLNLLRLNNENPLDERKPYKTPWAPRPYMAPFAFIPRYLEVNQRVCAGVYLRHPVAKRGYGEVPTPFPYEINQLAYTWYLKWRL